MLRVQMPSLYEQLASIHKPPTSICATQEAKDEEEGRLRGRASVHVQANSISSFRYE
jgi:hypothetical protein